MSEIIASGIIEKSTLQQYIDVFTPIVSEGKLHFDKDGLHIRVVDAANIAMVNGTIHANGFESYESPGSVVQGLDFERLENLIKPAGSSALIQLEMDMETRSLRISFDNVITGMGLIDPSSVRSEPDLPDIDLPNTVVLEGKELSKVSKVAGSISDHIKIEGYPDEKQLVFSAKGDIDKTTLEYDPENTIDGTKITADCYSLFSVDYFEKVVKPIPKNAEVTIQFGSEFPMIMSWLSNEGNVEVKQALAPRIEKD